MFAPRLLPLALLAALVPAAGAQSAFRLVRPLVVVGGVRASERVVLVQEPFRFLSIRLPGHGRYVVADQPFTGAQRVGAFDGERLAFTVEGQSVRVVADEPILDAAGPVPAYVRFDPDAAGGPPSSAGLSLAVSDVAGEPVPRRPAAAPPSPAETPSAPAPRPTAEPHAPAVTPSRAAAVSNLLAADLDALRDEVAALRAEVAALRSPAPPSNPAPATPATAGTAPAAGAARLTPEQERSADERDRLVRERARRATGQQRLDAERLQREVSRVQRSGEAASAPPPTPAPYTSAPVPPTLPAPSAPLPTLPPDTTAPEGPRPALTASLPGFDFARLQNADEIRRLLASTSVPEGVREGGVIVLFVTDTTGAIVRTEIADGLDPAADVLAEGIVRQMRLVLPVVEGLPAVLRSQLIVRFAR